MKLFASRKANAFVWIIGLAGLFYVAMAYLSLTGPFETIYNSTGNLSFTYAPYNSTRVLLRTTWQWWPALVVLGIVVWMFAQTLRRDNYGGYG